MISWAVSRRIGSVRKQCGRGNAHAQPPRAAQRSRREGHRRVDRATGSGGRGCVGPRDRFSRRRNELQRRRGPQLHAPDGRFHARRESSGPPADSPSCFTCCMLLPSRPSPRVQGAAVGGRSRSRRGLRPCRRLGGSVLSIDRGPSGTESPRSSAPTLIEAMGAARGAALHADLRAPRTPRPPWPAAWSTKSRRPASSMRRYRALPSVWSVAAPRRSRRASGLWRMFPAHRSTRPFARARTRKRSPSKEHRTRRGPALPPISPRSLRRGNSPQP